MIVTSVTEASLQDSEIPTPLDFVVLNRLGRRDYVFVVDPEISITLELPLVFSK